MTIAEKRLELAAALEAGGVPVTDPAAQLLVPGALIRPGDPWLAPAMVGGRMRTLTLSVLLVAGRADALSAMLDLEALAQAAVVALAGLAGWSRAPTSRARSMDLFGTTYLVGELTLETLLQLEDPTP